MTFLIKGILGVLIPMIMQLGVVNMVETTPQQAVDDFLSGLSSGDSKVTERYMDNEYVNTLVNATGSDKTVKRMYSALFENFTYKIEATAEKDSLAVVKVTITCNDFTGVRKAYDKASYKYVTSNLYEDKIADKSWLSEKCFEIYVKQIEKAAKEEPSEAVIYVPLEDDGSYGWNILLDDELMKSILGGLTFPE